ncbi:MAG: hypothetical protein CO108_07795 [Deltaproteobacteria bacterium CG_4_9_14_3_um_filter_63_12]|nr:MAG: hypothetical protein CO108_07795 [Deltaproteobacteria bacterium CG_4_9_14_3_um_filter_63_12]
MDVVVDRGVPGLDVLEGDVEAFAIPALSAVRAVDVDQAPVVEVEQAVFNLRHGQPQPFG